jgi:hypothetical protein
MDNLLENAKNLVEILIAVHAVALLIVNMTSTPKDDEALAKYYRIVEILAGFISKLAKK